MQEKTAFEKAMTLKEKEKRMIVVTGGAGFIGSNLVAGLEEGGKGPLVVCDVLGTEDKWRNIARRNVEDIVPPAALTDFLQGSRSRISAIFHMGAISATTERDADRIIENNFALSKKLWRFCAANDVPFIYASSAATYGDGQQGFVDGQTSGELARLRPLNPYGWSKHLFDRWVARVVESNDPVEKTPPQWAGLKFFNVYGPNEYHKGDMMSVMAKLYPKIRAGEPARLFRSANPAYGDGGQLRDFVYVRDCVDVMLWLMEREKVSGLFNVGTGRARSFKDLASAVFRAANVNERIEYIDMPVELRDKYQYFTQADMSKLARAGYDRPFTSLEDGVEAYVREFLSAGDRYR